MSGGERNVCCFLKKIWLFKEGEKGDDQLEEDYKMTKLETASVMRGKSQWKGEVHGKRVPY